uniref:Drebrin-like protein n=1 Tax=Cacopsylla melanoneura TaxID=428564 RepID=A0A8D9DS04_9HEMI
MAINVDKYKDSLVKAWKDVLDDKSSTDWALFGYEGQSYDLKVVSTGDGGIEELREDLSGGKIMYGFCKVLDPKTSLSKYVLINWQGEGAPPHMKGTCVNHLRHVQSLLKGAHITYNARTEEEVDEELISDKVGRSSASVYSFVDRSQVTPEPSNPVSAQYTRIIPSREINTVERDKFWADEEQKERVRQETERKKKEEEIRKLEEERINREMVEMVKRESEQIEQAPIKPARNGIGDVIGRENTVKQLSEQILQGNSHNKGNSEQSQDKGASEVIRSKGLSEQISSIEANNPNEVHKGLSEQISSKPNEVHKRLSEQILNGVGEQILSNSKQKEESKGASEQTIEHTSDSVTNGKAVINGDAAVYEENGVEEIEGPGQQAQALYDYQAADETEISFEPGDIITHIDQIDAGWWQGLSPDGTYGLFPANYVQLLE